MKGRSSLTYAVLAVAAAAAVGVLLSQRREARPADEAGNAPKPVMSAPGGQPSGAPPFTGPLQPGAEPLVRGGPSTPLGTGPQPGSGPRPPFSGGVTQQAVIDLNAAPVSALVTLPGITPEYARLIVEHRPYQDRPDLERKTGLPHSVVELLGPPAMIRSTSVERPK